MSWFGGYVNVSYNDTAKKHHQLALAGCGWYRRVRSTPVGGRIPAHHASPGGGGNSCNPSFSFYEIGSRTQWNPAPQLDVGFELLYSHLNTAYRGPGSIQRIHRGPRSP